MSETLLPLVVILGPTASGKTDLSIKLAKKFYGAIVSADSRQVYCGLDIGTSKISSEERKDVQHFLIDVVSPEEEFTLAHFQKLAFESIQTILEQKKIPFLVGGTGLYINAVIENFLIPEVPPNKKLRERLEKLDLEALAREFEQRNNDAFAHHIDMKNSRRVIRAIEMMEATGKNISELQKKGERKYRVLKFGIVWPREELYVRSDQVIDRMFQMGFTEEVKKLLQKGISSKWLESLGLEYRAVTQYLLGNVNPQSQKSMICQLKLDQHAFIRRQLTWFRHDKEIFWLSSLNAFRVACKEMNNFLLRR